jgi:hypothetical protein
MAKRRGRPPLEWISPTGLSVLQPGTAIAIEQTGRKAARTQGRIVQVTRKAVELATTTGTLTVPLLVIRRARIIGSLYEPGDPVLRRGVPEDVWRGGVVRTAGTDVLVEQIDGSFAWHSERDLEPAEAREVAPPALPRGPISSRA